MFRVRRFVLLLCWCMCGLSVRGLSQEIIMDPAFDIRERIGITDPLVLQVAYMDSTVGVLWAYLDQGDHHLRIKLAVSTDGGNTFRVFTPLFDRDIGQGGIGPQGIAVTPGEVHVAYTFRVDPPPYQWLLSSCRLVLGKSPDCRRLDVTSDDPFDNLRIAAFGSGVYIAWNDLSLRRDVHLMHSTDGGVSFSDPINLTNDENPGNRRSVRDLVATGNDVYLRWDLDNRPFLMHLTVP